MFFFWPLLKNPKLCLKIYLLDFVPTVDVMPNQQVVIIWSAWGSHYPNFQNLPPGQSDGGNMSWVQKPQETPIRQAVKKQKVKDLTHTSGLIDETSGVFFFFPTRRNQYLLDCWSCCAVLECTYVWVCMHVCVCVGTRGSLIICSRWSKQTEFSRSSKSAPWELNLQQRFPRNESSA